MSVVDQPRNELTTDPSSNSASGLESVAPSAPRYFSTTGCLGNLPFQAAKRYARKGTTFNIVVCGKSGLGKTTFLNMLFHSKSSSTDSTSTTCQDKQSADKYSLKTTQLDIKQFEVESNGYFSKFTTIDTMQFGDYINNANCWVPVSNYIDKQHMLYMFQEEQPDRTRLIDTRVHACIYFIEPNGHGLSEIDIQALREFSLRANVIPVIGKADSMTPASLHRFKEVIKRQLVEHGIKVFGELDPFALVCSNNETKVHGKRFFTRTYGYGTVNCEDSQHSDFTALKNLLLHTGTLDLIESSHSTFYHYQRIILMQYRRNKLVENRNEVASSASCNEPNDFSSTKSNLDRLKQLTSISYESMEKERIEKDSLFLEKVREIKAQYDDVAGHQLERFSKIQKNLEEMQEGSKNELKQLKYDINELQERVNALREKVKHRNR